ncbi:hypothetical protein [Azospirillum sp.]|uniref:hypothetical protein n=1 Tax=Azospirillum sp. TaxID=34012 RepID=UPI002D2971DB|nr:hypothetical protein [Azospirillum sp.]HYD66964.1 hypothetical protein [Azospirillum sp.]
MTAIPKPETSLYESAPDDLKPTLDEMVERVKNDANWKVRKKTLMDVLSVLDVATALTEEQRLELDRVMRGIEDGTISAEEAERALETLEQMPDAEVSENDDGEDEVSASADVLPMFIGAILERLGEERITCVEQAALYLLSAHDEHALAAEQWLQEDFKHGKEFKKLLRTDRRYESLFELILAPEFEEDEEDDVAEGDEGGKA